MAFGIVEGINGKRPRAVPPDLDLAAPISANAVAIKRIACAAKIADYTVLQNNGALGGQSQTVSPVHFHRVPAWREIERLHVEREARIAV